MTLHTVAPAWTALVRRTYGAEPAAHAATVRWTYTVPAGRMAVVEHAYVEVAPTTAALQCFAWVVVVDSGGTDVIALVMARSTTAIYERSILSPQVTLDEGEKLEGRTVNTDSVGRGFGLGALLREIVK